MSRITDFTNNQVEIHSFPGMTLSQANKLIENYPHGADSQDPATQPRDFIISVGINDRANASSTIRTCINKMYYSCRRKFPNSRVCMPEVNCDQRLPGANHETIRDVNSSIKARFGMDCTIPLLSSSMFNTCAGEKYPFIHWTEQCANAMLKHWLVCLN